MDAVARLMHIHCHVHIWDSPCPQIDRLGMCPQHSVFRPPIPYSLYSYTYMYMYVRTLIPTHRPDVSQKSTFATDFHLKYITWDHQSLQQEHAGPIPDGAVPLHLFERKPSLSGTTLCWLTSEHGMGTLWSGVHLVEHHVFQLLVIDGAKEA